MSPGGQGRDCCRESFKFSLDRCCYLSERSLWASIAAHGTLKNISPTKRHSAWSGMARTNRTSWTCSACERDHWRGFRHAVPRSLEPANCRASPVGAPVAFEVRRLKAIAASWLRRPHGILLPCHRVMSTRRARQLVYKQLRSQWCLPSCAARRALLRPAWHGVTPSTLTGQRPGERAKLAGPTWALAFGRAAQPYAWSSEGAE